MIFDSIVYHTNVPIANKHIISITNIVFVSVSVHELVDEEGLI